MFNLFTFIVGLLLSISAVQTDLERHLYVKPTPTSSGCPQDEVCMTFSDYLQSVSDYFTSNTTIHLLPGNHTISEPGYSLLVSNTSNLSLSGHAGDTTLYCTERFSLAFVNAANVSISGISIINCGRTIGNLLKDINFIGFKMPVNTKAALALINIHSVMLQNVRIAASYGYGLLAVSVFGDSIVTSCTFTHNMWRSDGDDTSSVEDKPGGNVLFVFPLHIRINKIILGIHISQCEFAHGADTTALDFETWTEQSIISGGSGLGILLYTNRKDYYDSVMNYVTTQKPAINMNIEIRDSTFHHNSAPHGPGANLLIVLHNYVVPQNDTLNENRNVFFPLLAFLNLAVNHFLGPKLPILRSTVYINNCSFRDGSALKGGGIFVGSAIIGGPAKIIVKLSNSHIFDNVVESTGGGLCFIYKEARNFDHAQRFLIDNCTFSNNTATQGGAVHIAAQWEEVISLAYIQPIFSFFFGLSKSKNNEIPIEKPTININISQAHFLQNTARGSGGGMDVFLYTTRDPLKPIVHVWGVTIVCTDCRFIENEAESGYAASVRGCGKINGDIDKVIGICAQAYGTLVQFFNAKMKNNGVYKRNRDRYTSTLCLYNTEKILLSNSTISGNSDSAVYVIGSKLFISGVVKIIDNHGVSGGGLYFDCNPRSFLYLTPHAQLYMANNTASLHGGAIAAQDCSALGNDECFIQLDLEFANYNCSLSSDVTVNERIQCYDTKVTMENNTALVAGDSIYSSSFETCYLILGSDSHKIDSNIFQSLFVINNTQSLSEVASDPFHVCFCPNTNESDCVTETQVEVYPGQTFHIPAVGVGQFNNASPSIIRTMTSTETEQLLGEGQGVQELGRECGLLTYFVKSFEDVILQLSVEKASQISPPATVSVIILECPPGFENSDTRSVCDCELHLTERGIKCDIDSQKFHQPGSMWIGYYGEEQVTIHTNCPFHYCKSEENEFTLDNQDDQCASNHSGVLCGACQQGLSLALGTSQCLKCSNVYLLLLIPFALAGVALVFLLLKCNLTVSVGSINGLIFYANIVQVNHPTFFPQGAQNMNLLTKCLSLFIAWLNLDFGIQTCFFTGMNTYTKTWLQFVFPAYVWSMVGFMIYGSRHFPTASRLIGSHAVQVLATLFLLSYAKLLRTVIAASYSTALIGRNSSTPLVWLMDGNVPFFRGTHIALLLMALVVILIYIVPFTVLVLLTPCLQANSNRRILRFFNIKLKPLLDAYQGPYKDKFRYWTGLMLLIRVVLFTIFAGNILGKPEINLFAVIVVITLLVMFGWNAGSVYKNRLWNIVESFYLLNLLILAAATLLLRSLEEPSSRAQEIVTDVMAGTAFALFCAIVLYHVCVYVVPVAVSYCQAEEIKTRIWEAMRRLKFRHQEHPTAAAGPNDTPTVHQNEPTVTHIELNLLREPLLSENY